MKNTMLVALYEAKTAADKSKGGIKKRFKAAVNAVKHHWLITDEDEKFRCAIGGLLESFKEGTPEFERISKEIEGLRKVSVMIQAGDAGLIVSVPEMEDNVKPIGLLKLWKEYSSD